VRTRQALGCARRKNAGPTDQEYGSRRNSGETRGPTRLERLLQSDAKLYRVPKVEGRRRRSVQLGRQFQDIQPDGDSVRIIGQVHLQGKEKTPHR
jgi:hypothetical protein